ncbi:MAG: hypothetical protein IIB00_04705, partial [candidate division Zixibacteria bacterium]|nr:hypothetical protein [candidate division Zixibacteria bacterium]
MPKAMLFASVLALTMATASQAASPQMINYQGLLTDNVGNPVTDASYSVVFTIYDAAMAGTSVWTETQNVTTSDGLFTVLLGSINPILDTVFNETTRYLGIAVAGDPEINPRTAFATAPYSFRTATVDGSTGGIISGDVSIQSDLSVSGKATIGPGHTNSGVNAFIAGQDNTASGDYSTVSGGLNNIATGTWSSVGGGADNTAGTLYSTVGGGTNNTVSGTYSAIAGGIQNQVSGQFSAILGGFGDTIQSTANYSYLFGIKSILTQDSTFMVDMPHIRFGDEATGFEFPPVDGTSGQVMSTDGSGQLAWTAPGGGGEPSGWFDNGTVVLLDNSDDSVGIGTATPDAPVHILKESNSATPAFGFHTEFKNIGTGGGI